MTVKTYDLEDIVEDELPDQSTLWWCWYDGQSGVLIEVKRDKETTPNFRGPIVDGNTSGDRRRLK